VLCSGALGGVTFFPEASLYQRIGVISNRGADFYIVV
jgi:hypothetical protein